MNILALNILTENAVHVFAAKALNIKMPEAINQAGILFIESDYSSKVLLESSKNPQRFVFINNNNYELKL